MTTDNATKLGPFKFGLTDSRSKSWGLEFYISQIGGGGPRSVPPKARTGRRRGGKQRTEKRADDWRRLQSESDRAEALKTANRKSNRNPMQGVGPTNPKPAKASKPAATKTAKVARPKAARPKQSKAISQPPTIDIVVNHGKGEEVVAVPSSLVAKVSGLPQREPGRRRSRGRSSNSGTTAPIRPGIPKEAMAENTGVIADIADRDSAVEVQKLIDTVWPGGVSRIPGLP